MGIQETFARNMRSYRRQADLTQEKLAELCGFHRTYIGGIEQKRINVSLKNIAKIADAMDLDPALLLMNPDSQELKLLQQTQSDASASKLKSGDYALCTWTDEGVIIEPIEVTDEDMTMRILSTLASQECQDIIKRYNGMMDLMELILKDAESRTEEARDLKD